MLLASLAQRPSLDLASETSPSPHHRLSLPRRHFPPRRFHSRSGSGRAPNRRRLNLQLVRKVPLNLEVGKLKAETGNLESLIYVERIGAVNIAGRLVG